jgi:hypothetical protein
VSIVIEVGSVEALLDSLSISFFVDLWFLSGTVSIVIEVGDIEASLDSLSIPFFVDLWFLSGTVSIVIEVGDVEASLDSSFIPFFVDLWFFLVRSASVPTKPFRSMKTSPSDILDNEMSMADASSVERSGLGVRHKSTPPIVTVNTESAFASDGIIIVVSLE